MCIFPLLRGPPPALIYIMLSFWLSGIWRVGGWVDEEDPGCVRITRGVSAGYRIRIGRCGFSIRNDSSVSLDGSCARKAKANREVYTVQAAEADREDGRKGCAIVDAAMAAFTLAPQQGRRVRHHNT